MPGRRSAFVLLGYLVQTLPARAQRDAGEDTPAFRGPQIHDDCHRKGRTPRAVAEKVAQLRKQGVVFPVGLDPYEKISQLLGDERIPQLVIIGPDTRVRYHEVGYTPERLDEAAEIIEKLLNEQP